MTVTLSSRGRSVKSQAQAARDCIAARLSDACSLHPVPLRLPGSVRGRERPDAAVRA